MEIKNANADTLDSVIELDVKRLTEDGEFQGYASTFKNTDLVRDVIAVGAFDKTLKQRGAGGVKMLAHHDQRQPIGIWEDLKVDKRGLFAKGKLLMEIPRVRDDVYIAMKQGAMTGLSIGFRTVEDEWDEGKRIRIIKEVDLWEISAVVFPANPKAGVRNIKNSFPTERDIERLLTQDAGLTRREARIVINEGFKSLSATQDASQNTVDGTPFADFINSIKSER